MVRSLNHIQKGIDTIDDRALLRIHEVKQMASVLGDVKFELAPNLEAKMTEALNRLNKKNRNQNESSTNRSVNGDTRFLISFLMKKGIPKDSMEPEADLPGSMLNADILILNPDPNKDYPEKGIVIELDGPYHYYSPQKKDGVLRLTSHSKTRNKLIKKMNYKMLNLSA